MSRVVFFLTPGIQLLDLAGPAQVFDTAATLGQSYHLEYVAERSDVRTAQGLVVQAECRWPALTVGDLVVVPGWRAPRLRDGPVIAPAALRRLRDHHEAGGTVASVCAGADALGRAGLLDGRRCTTHHAVQDELAAQYPRAIVVRDVLYTTDDRVVTSAGIASGIDLALHLLAVRHGPAFAARTARAMVVFARRNGTDPQTSVMLRHRDHLSDLVHRAQDIVNAKFTEPLPLAELAGQLGVSGRTLARLFTDATDGTTPLRYQQALRVERAERLMGQGATADLAARQVGFTDARMLRRLRARSRTDLKSNC